MLSEKPPLLIKIAPDLTREGMEDIAAVITRGKVGYLLNVYTLAMSPYISYCICILGGWSRWYYCK